MKKKETSFIPPKDGVQAIALVVKNKNIFKKKYLIILDFDDRKTGTGIKKYGIVGGGIEKDKTKENAIVQEFWDEAGNLFKKGNFKLFGCYKKTRKNNFINDNYLFIIKLKFESISLYTNQPEEVSEVCLKSLEEIISLCQEGKFHEGSIRLIFLWLKGIHSGSLDEPVEWNNFRF